MEIILDEKDLRNIVEGTMQPPPSDADGKGKRSYNRKMKKAFDVIACNLEDMQLADVQTYKGPTEAWPFFCNFHETKSLSNVLFILCKFLHV